MNIIFLLFFGLAPSIIWLLFYLRKDAHPESNQMILKVFLLGMGIAFSTVFIEIGAKEELNKLPLPHSLAPFFYVFLGIALVEESLKYFVVKEKVQKSSELDEPLDVMLYMIIVALGFAALENILVLLSLKPPLLLLKTFSVTIIRFVSATFLHALCSGTFGFFLALSFFYLQKSTRFFLIGLSTATLLHGLYNFFIIKIESSIVAKEGLVAIKNGDLLFFYLFSIISILVILALFVSFGFKKLKKTKSICKLK